MTSLLWREMQLEGRKRFFSTGISSRNSKCLCFALFMNAQIGQTEKPQGPFIMYENVLFIRGKGWGKVKKLTEKRRKSGL